LAKWPKNPTIYEINTWVWLQELSQTYQRPVTLATVPPNEWDDLAALGFDAVWLMGVWERSPMSVRVAREHETLQRKYRSVLPDFAPEDVVGSPYAVHRYLVDQHLGGPEGLEAAKKTLAQRDIRLILDFVANHLALDHSWVFEHPEYLIEGSGGELQRSPPEFFQAGDKIFAHGRDPHFPPWTDTVQLNTFAPALRQALRETLLGIAAQCDGVRCDMAMLLVNDIFATIWKERAGRRPSMEFWPQAIRAVRRVYPDFLFVAEAYWDTEQELQHQGFDFCYDKRMYDHLLYGDAEDVRRHLRADVTYQQHLVRFLENHDEPRAAAVFRHERLRAAAVTAATIPGAKLFHEGQLEGRQVKVPVQLGRRPSETKDVHLQAFYRRLLRLINVLVFREGDWGLCEVSDVWGTTDNRQLAAWCCRREEARRLVVLNLSGLVARGRVRLCWNDLAGRKWLFLDALIGEVYERQGDEMLEPGLSIVLQPWGFHFFELCEAEKN
jgi:hypothetical protein